MTEKIKVAIIYGGRSGEHEISLLSAASVLRNLDKDRFEIVPIGIDKDGKWHYTDLKVIDVKNVKALPINKNDPVAILPAHAAGKEIMVIGQQNKDRKPIDIVFPIMHGPLCEDGSIQGLFEQAGIAYVGAGVLGSAIGMDKDIAKRLVQAKKLPIVPYLCLHYYDWKSGEKKVRAQIKKVIRYPLFVKPANLGSSVGVHKVHTEKELAEKLNDAFLYDTKVLVEKAINAREIEISVLENTKYGDAPLVSIPGEIRPTHEFYSYEAKYLDEQGAELIIPAKLNKSQIKNFQSIAGQVFTALECEGMARVDFLMDKKSGKIYFNEINTIPGFTTISMYPKLWEASGIPYQELLSRLIDLALQRHERKQALKREFN